MRKKVNPAIPPPLRFANPARGEAVTASVGRKGRGDGGTAAGAAWWCMALMWSLWSVPGCHSDELLSTDVMMPVRRIMMPGSAAPVCLVAEAHCSGRSRASSI